MGKRKNPETSDEAFKSLVPEEIREIYRKILASLSVLGEADFEEIAAHAKVDKGSVWRRMNELMKMDLIYRPGNKRKLKSGRFGYTWMLTSDVLPKTKAAEKVLQGKTVADFSRDIQKLSLPIQANLFPANDAV
jgi:predicted transcriptional regulator